MTKIARIALIANPLLQSRGEIALKPIPGEKAVPNWLCLPQAVKQRRKK